MKKVALLSSKELKRLQMLKESTENFEKYFDDNYNCGDDPEDFYAHVSDLLVDLNIALKPF